MLRRAFLLFAWLVFGAPPGLTAEVANSRPRENAVSPPVPGSNFIVADPPLAMIWVAPGTFLLSATHGAGDDTLVRLTRGYWLGRTEVTQAQWRAVMDYVPLPSFFKGSERPVERVSWDLAMVFCSRLTERERAADRLPEGYAYTLPTEAQWEYACRAGTTGLHAGDIEAMAWYDANSDEQTHPVAQKRANAWGFHDMHGNVSEWCWDWYAGYPGGNASDPAGPPVGMFHVLRGGGWGSSAGGCRSALRWWSPTNGGGVVIGFRLALAPQIGTPRPTSADRSVSVPAARK